MLNNVYHQDHRCNIAESLSRSPARRIKYCRIRTSFDDKRRAHETVCLLRARDSRIAFLEKRVAELENVAESLHEISLRHSARNYLDKMDSQTDENPDSGGCPPMPILRLSSTSNSNQEIFSNSGLDSNPDLRAEQNDYHLSKSPVTCKSYSKLRETSFTEIDGSEMFAKNANKNRDEKYMKDKSLSSASAEDAGTKIRKFLHAKEQRRNLPMRTSSSVPWIRGKHSSRKKLRGVQWKSATRRANEIRPDSSEHLTNADRAIEMGERDRFEGQSPRHIEAKNPEKKTVADREVDKALVDAQEAPVTAVERKEFETRTSYTQTVNSKEKQALKNLNRLSTSSIHLEEKSFSTFWNIEEDCPSQLMLRVAFGKESDICDDAKFAKTVDVATDTGAGYETVISELEAKLGRMKIELDEAIKLKSIAKEKYKRNLENAKAEAVKENEKLQESIVRICTSVMENFGPRAAERKRRNVRSKSHRRPRCHEKVTKKLHKNLRAAVAKLNKLQRELTETRQALKDKSTKYASVNVCFARLKEELDTTEISLNSLISENVALRKKIEDTREWMELKIGKDEKTTKFRDAQRNRELTNLRKKAEEDFATIAELRNRLLRSESANANKGFLLNSYKSQVTDFYKETKELGAKINALTSDVEIANNDNALLKAEISVLNKEKENLVSGSEKARTDAKEKEVIGCTKNCKELFQQEVKSLKTKHKETIEKMKININLAETRNTEYLKALQKLLKKLHDHSKNQETEKNLTETEAACNMFNEMPEELPGLIKENSLVSIDTWMVELNRITAKDKFSKSLTKFLLEKAFKEMNT